MNLNHKTISLSKLQETEISRLLKQSKDFSGSDLEKMWYMMDIVWDELGCDNKKLDWKKIEKFYNHPVWLLNGLFIEQHDLSMQHRHAISDWIVNNKTIKTVLDYGGGYGTLAKLIAEKNPSLSIDIYEPHPSNYAKQRLANYPNIKFVDEFKIKYDVLISTDVLEHVPKPLLLFQEMIRTVKDDGYLIIANCFYPVIKCHLACTFHFRYTFNIFAKHMGLEVIGLLEGSHATLFRKKPNVSVNLNMIKFLEIISKAAFPFLELSKPIVKPVYHFFKR